MEGTLIPCLQAEALGLLGPAPPSGPFSSLPPPGAVCSWLLNPSSPHMRGVHLVPSAALEPRRTMLSKE